MVALMPSLAESCSMCNVCGFVKRYPSPMLCEDSMGEYDAGMEPARPLLLVIDDLFESEEYKNRQMVVSSLLPVDIAFTYTSTVRCSVLHEDMIPGRFDVILSRCSVWTNSLLDERLVILSTVNGLKQMKVEKDYNEGDMFKSVRLGVVLVIPPIKMLGPRDRFFSVYQEKVKRVMKEAGLL